jgi:hypothetical protein
MSYREKLPTSWYAWSPKAALLIAAVSISTFTLGCSGHLMEQRVREQDGQEIEPRALLASGQLAATDLPEHSSPNQHPPAGAKKEVNGHGKLEEDDHEAQDEKLPPKLKITMPMAIELCVANNFRVLAGAEKIRMAEGRHQRKEKNLQLQQRTLPLPEGEEVACH